MTGRDRRFPLSLSSVVEKAPKSQYAASFVKVETPQTATQNAAQNAARTYCTDNSSKAKLPMAVSVSSSARSTPLVSDAIREAMVNRIAKQGIKDAQVLAAMEAIPRHLFVEPALASQAYIDAALPIGYHQTISQPYIVARMIEIMRCNAFNGTLNRVLEIGTGCGYQAAVLSLLANEVYSIERIKPLHELAKANLRPLRIANIRLHYGDGMLGLPAVAPFDGIILAAAGLEVPQALLEQLTIGGRLIAPVGSNKQVLRLIERVSKFEWTNTALEGCHFVPLCSGVI